MVQIIIKSTYKITILLTTAGVILCFFNIYVYADTFVIPTNGVENYTVELVAHVQESPPKITLEWPDETGETGYTVYRKSLSATTWGTAVANLSASSNTYEDTAVDVGVGYEYRVVKAMASSTAYGYIYSGINMPVTESRGTLILIVDSTLAESLATELSTLGEDLIGDGWTVIRHDVSPNDTVASVKSLIVSDYTADSINVNTVFLVGHVPVPYSGNLAPDGHSEHRGAWPADLYYGEMNGTWNDVSVNQTASARAQNHNIPGDGKFDSTTIPSNIELSVGRVDLHDMPAFGESETELMRRYLEKDHEYRQTNFILEKQAIIEDNFGPNNGEAFAQSGWQNFPAMIGGSAIVSTSSDFMASITEDSYLLSFGAGSGGYTGAGGVGSTGDYAAAPKLAVFNMLFGSYFGDWDNTDNFLRAPLAAEGYGLVSVWSGRPIWRFHHMAMGHTVGYGARASQNNSSSGPYKANAGTRQVHVGLMGDPTLRLNMIPPPSGLSAIYNQTEITLSWTVSIDPDVLGYYIYRSTAALGPFVRITSSLVSGNSYSENLSAGSYFYMVRALKLEETPSGTYYNLSQGVSADVEVVATNQAPVVNAGVDQEVTLPDDSVDLVGDVTDDGLPDDTLSVLWSVVNGQSGVSFTATTSTSTIAVFPAAGTYTLRLTGSDGVLSSSDDLVVTVINLPNTPPTISEILDQEGHINAPSSLIPFTVDDEEAPVSDLVITATSDNQDIVMDNQIIVSSLGDGQYVLEIHPQPNVTGTVKIAVSVSDGQDSEGTSFTYEVKAIPDITPPFVPSGLSTSVLSSSEIEVSWSASADIGTDSGEESGLAGYLVYQNGIQVATTTDTSYLATGLSGATEYSFSIATYDENDNVSLQSSVIYATTATPVPNNNTGGSRSSIRGNSRRVLATIPIVPTTLPLVVAPIKTLPIIFASLGLWDHGQNVVQLQRFLINGGYLAKGYDTGYFGLFTEAAIKEFKKENSPIITIGIRAGSSGLGVRALQQFLNNNGFNVSPSGPGSPGNETDFFGLATYAAVIKFQSYYAADILTPQGLTAPTGIIGNATVAKINSLIK